MVERGNIKHHRAEQGGTKTTATKSIIIIALYNPHVHLFENISIGTKSR
jgi:hypothetical protein